MAFRDRLAKLAKLIAEDADLSALYDSHQHWPSQFDEPLVMLIDHADSEGDLSPDQCRRLAPRLRELLALIPAGDYDRESGERLAAACEDCAARGAVLEFC